MAKSSEKEPRPASLVDAPPKTVRIDKGDPEPFEILEQAGAGGMGTVYRARDRQTGAPLAVKVLRDVTNDITRFALESEILARLRHPSIVEYRHHGLTKEGYPYLAMEWVDGESLEQKLLEGGNLSVEETLRVARTVAEALSVAHAEGVIHRDLKPTNILLTKENQAVKLVDFGIARSEDTTGLTATGQALGTPGYMAPEQARGLPVDERADLFSLGCVMFRCLGGRRPFGGSDLMQFATNLALHEAPRLREIAPHTPIGVESLVAKLLQKDPKSRPESAIEVRKMIDRILNEEDATRPKETERAPDAALATPPTESDGVATTLPGPAAAELPPKKPSPSVPKTLKARAIGDEASGSEGGPSSDASTMASSPSDKTTSPTRRSPKVFLGLAAAIGIGSVAVAIMTRTNTPSRPLPSSPPPTGVASSASAARAGVDPADHPTRGGLDRACRQWANVLTRGQRSDGAFAGEVRADPTGWDTGQQLYAITLSRQACDEVGPNPIASGVRALGELRLTDGWAGPQRSAIPKAELRSATPANAWAVLALDRIARDMPSGQATKLAALARADVLRARNEDGGFRYQASKQGPSTAYSTLLAAWALEDDPKVLTAATTWLKKEVLANGDGLRELGFTEQVAWFLAKVGVLKSEPEVSSALVADLIAHCRLSQAGCAMPARETGKVRSDVDGGKLITFWHPWSTLAATVISRRDAERAESRELDLISKWGIAELGRSVDSLGSIQEYKLAEYLIVTSELLLMDGKK